MPQLGENSSGSFREAAPGQPHYSPEKKEILSLTTVDVQKRGGFGTAREIERIMVRRVTHGADSGDHFGVANFCPPLIPAFAPGAFGEGVSWVPKQRASSDVLKGDLAGDWEGAGVIRKAGGEPRCEWWRACRGGFCARRWFGFAHHEWFGFGQHQCFEGAGRTGSGCADRAR